VTPKTFYAKDLLSTAAQVEAANQLMNVLLVRRMMQGERLSFWARKWGRPQPALHKSTATMRSLLVALEKGNTGISLYIPDPMPLRELEAKPDVYGPLLDRIEMEACMDLDDGRTEALIRRMFDKEPQYVFAGRVGRAPKKDDKKQKRGPGRPKGAKNKPKVPQHDGDGWLMPDGSRLAT
jgi:hypothetical protein